MAPPAADPSASIRARFVGDHLRLEAVLERFLLACAASDHPEMARLWAEFESGLLAHLQMEESHLFPLLQRASPTNTRILAQEHRHVRTRLAELHLALDLGQVRLDAAQSFAHELRAHISNEERILYQWADERLDDDEKESVLQALSERASGN